jgi:hypothetical protein
VAGQDSYGQGVVVASLTDAPNAETLARNIADAIVQRSIMRFASASARSATLTTPAEGMVAWLQDTNQLSLYDGTSWVVIYNYTDVTTAGAVAASGFSVAFFEARKAGGVCSFSVEVTRTGSSINATAAGNIDDILTCALPAGWRPAVNVSAGCGNGFGAGEVRVETDGQIYIRAWSGNGSIGNGDTVRISACFVL